MNSSLHATSLPPGDEQFRVTLCSIGDAVVATDAAGNVSFMNPVAEKLTGWNFADAAGQPLSAVFHVVSEDTRERLENPVERVLREGHVVGLGNHTLLIARNGAEHAIDDRAAPVREPGGIVQGVVLVFRDIDERRRAERDASRLASIVEHSVDAIIGKNLNGIVTSWNKAAERIFGYSGSEMIGQSIRRLIPADRQSEEDHILARLRQGEVVEAFESVRLHKDGRHLHMRLSISPIRDGEGHIIGVSKIARDITRQREVQEQLRVTLASIGDGVISTDDKGNVAYLNAVAEGLTGWRLADAAGQPLSAVFKIVHEFTREPVENPVERVLREGRIVGLGNHTTLIARDGTERQIDDSAAPVREIGGLIRGVVLVFRDVSERRRAELNALRLATIVEHSADAIVGKDLNGIVTSWNKGAERTFGYTAEEMISQSIRKLIPPDRQEEEDQILRRLRSGEIVEAFDTIRLHKDGRQLHMQLTISPMKDKEGQNNEVRKRCKRHFDHPAYGSARGFTLIRDKRRFVHLHPRN